jgi:hypothetical protein
MWHGVLRNDNLWLRRGPTGHRLVTSGAELYGVFRFWQRAIGRMLAGGAVTHLAFDGSMRACRPLAVALGVTSLAVCRPPELWCRTERHLDNGIASITTELVVGGIEDVVSRRDGQNQERS